MDARAMNARAGQASVDVVSMLLHDAMLKITGGLRAHLRGCCRSACGLFHSRGCRLSDRGCCCSFRLCLSLVQAVQCQIPQLGQLENSAEPQPTGTCWAYLCNPLLLGHAGSCVRDLGEPKQAIRFAGVCLLA